MDKLNPQTDGATPNIVEQNIEKLKTLFPDVFTEGKVDLDALRETLGDYADERQERYSFTWNGKARARRIAQTPSTGTLRPCPEESVNWDATQNLFIEGENLEVLKLLQKSYHKKIKMIYIDPPYNTGRDFIYPDDFRDTIKSYMELTGQADEEGRRFSANAETLGRYHTNWLNMMYPRLKLARNLLCDDGVMFVSIGDEELANLVQISNLVFGEDNFIGCVTRIAKTTSFRGNFLAPSKDYVLCYSKDISNTLPFRDEVDASQYKKVEVHGPRSGEKYRDDIAFYLSTLETRPNQRYFIECPDGSRVLPPGRTFPPAKPVDGDGVWRWSEDNFNSKKELIVIKPSNRSPLIDSDGRQAQWNIYTKSYLSDKLAKGNIPRDFWDKMLNRYGTAELKTIGIPYSFPKPTTLIKKMLKVTQTSQDDIVLDFFSGSCTTADAVLKLNHEDGDSRRFIMVQLPESCDETSEAFKAGYSNIADIGKERIRRVIKKLETERAEKANKAQATLLGNTEDIPELDLGFKVFKFDASNIKSWDADFDNLETALFDAVENIKPDRTEADVLYELLLKYGLDLAVPIEQREIAEKIVYIIGVGALIVCLSEKISLDVVEGIAALKVELMPEIMRVVFKDSGFTDDVVKTNTVQILRQAGIEDVKSL